ncbi:MAG TPA: ATP-binding protein [Acidimicrobiales bacterium]|nr:ATP-binding protein [Acidimicrobiales bacterium]
MSATAYTQDLTMTLAPEALSVRASRRELGRLLRAVGWAPLGVERAVLAVTELVANAVVHGRSDVVVRCQVGERLRLEVTDSAGDAELRTLSATAKDTGGRGLNIVDTVSRSWGVVRGTGTKTVWCELEPAGEALAATG